MTQALGSADGVTITGPPEDRYDEVLTDRALELIAQLHRSFGARRRELLRRPPGAVRGAGRRRHARLPARRPRTSARTSWRVAEPAPGLVDRRVEITGPTDRKMTINALNSGRQGVAGRLRGRQHPALGEHASAASSTCATRSTGTIDFTSPEGKDYALADDELRHDRRPPARLAPAGEAHPGRRRADLRQPGRLRALLLPLRAGAARRAARARTSTCRRWRATSRRGSGTTCSSLAQELARHPARHHPRDRADRDLPGRVRDGGDPLRAARALRRAQRRPLGLHVPRHQEVPHPRRASSCCPTATR